MNNDSDEVTQAAVDDDDAPGGPLYSWNFIILFGVFDADVVGVNDVADAIGVEEPGFDDVPSVADVALRIPHGPMVLRDLLGGRSLVEEALATELAAAAAADEAFKGQLQVAVRAAESGAVTSAAVDLTPDISPIPAVAFDTLVVTPAGTNYNKSCYETCT